MAEVKVLSEGEHLDPHSLRGSKSANKLKRKKRGLKKEAQGEPQLPENNSSKTVTSSDKTHSNIEGSVTNSTSSKAMEKSRKEVMEEREARKAAKASKKKGVPKDAAASAPPKPDQGSKVPDVTPKVDSRPTPLPVPEPLVGDAPVNETQASAGKTEKSREEIKAEREKKKLAKMALKSKAKEPKDEETKLNKENVSNTTANPKIEKDQPTNDKLTPDTQNSQNAETKSKAELRAERRALQEAQRAAKASAKVTPVAPEKTSQPPVPKTTPSRPVKEVVVEKEKKSSILYKVDQHKLFSHLHHEPKRMSVSLSCKVHPSIVKLGEQYSSKVVSGSNARCIAFLKSLKEVIVDYVTPSQSEFSRGLESELSTVMSYLASCRPHSVSMTNALRHIKSHLSQLPNEISDGDAKRKLTDVIDTFIREQIEVADLAISNTLKEKICNDDVILIYGCSSLLSKSLIESHRSGTQFSVVVVDGGPWYEGREMLRRLVAENISCTYVLISAVSFIMRQATKVLIGAHALLANGYVMSRVGSSLVALMAKTYNVPVLVCCETYKFCERVQTDAFVYNELGDPSDVAPPDSAIANWQSIPYLAPLSLVYDVTPPDLVTAVVTELAILPCTSVPVILRVKPSDLVT